VLVDLIDDHGPEKIIALTDALVDEKHAQAVISTAHKSKGREWDTVYLAADFREPRPTPANPDPVIPDELAMLLYVARTRARLGLDQSATAWVDKFLPAGQVRAA
jgi:superfamily I DNA/RNA helicase